MKNVLALFVALCLSIIHLHAKNANEQTFTLTDIKGNTYTIQGTQNGFKVKGHEDKVVFLEFFGYRCPPCLSTIPHLIELQHKYQDKLLIIALEVQGLSNEQLKDFVKRKGINYISVADGKDGGFINYIARRAQWNGSIPFLVALDTNNEVRFIQIGLIPLQELETLISQLDLNQKTQTQNVHAKEANASATVPAR